MNFINVDNINASRVAYIRTRGMNAALLSVSRLLQVMDMLHVCSLYGTAQDALRHRTVASSDRDVNQGYLSTADRPSQSAIIATR